MRLNGFIDSFSPEPVGWKQHAGTWSGVSVGDTIIQSSGLIALSGFRNFHVDVFGTSGGMEFRGGPFPGLYVKTLDTMNLGGNPFGLANDGFWPVALSGIFGMQDTYNANPNVYIAAGHGNMFFFADTRNVRFIAGQKAPILISGSFISPIAPQANANNTGDIYACAHQEIARYTNFTAPTSDAEVSARGLGIQTLCLNTGSGIINLSVGSGICQLAAAASTTLPYLDDNWIRLPMYQMVFSDLAFASDPTNSGIFFMAPGMYMVNYNISIDKIATNVNRCFATRATLRTRATAGDGFINQTPISNTGPVITGSIAYGAVVNTVTFPFATLSATFLVNANRGDFLGFEAATVGTNGLATQTVTIATSGCSAVVRYIGPRRSGF